VEKSILLPEKGKILHFIEVKVLHVKIRAIIPAMFPRETGNYRPEDNIHPAKLKRLSRTVQVYLLDKYPKGEPDWYLMR